jgi:hypothetical protein
MIADIVAVAPLRVGGFAKLSLELAHACGLRAETTTYQESDDNACE